MSETVYGLHAVRALLERDGAAELWLLEGRRDRRLTELEALAVQRGVPVRRAARARLDELAGGGRHQGALARAAAASAALPADLDALLAGIQGPPLLLVLDGVQDPHNLGACLRTANAAGVHGVLAPRDRATGLTPAARKVASGAAEATPFIQVTNLARALRRLREAGIWVVGTAGEGGTGLFEADLRGPLALVMGAEERGLRRLTREHCDLLVRLPMAGTVESLNVSVAAGICLYEALRQRAAGGG